MSLSDFAVSLVEFATESDLDKLVTEGADGIKKFSIQPKATGRFSNLVIRI